jgi:RNA polymerase sigma-70 factor (ECF subfamily)
MLPGQPMPAVKRGAWEEVWEAGRAAWPGVSLRRDHLSSYLDGLSKKGGAVAPEALERADVYLVCACLRGIPQAIEVFERTQIEPLKKVLARHVTIEPALLDDVLQGLRTDLFARGELPSKLLSYSGRGKVRAWLTTIALRAAREARPTDSEAPASLASAVALEQNTPELQSVKAAHRQPFREAFAEAMASLTVRERNVLRMHLLDGLNVDRIGGAYDVHRATAARWIQAARQKLVERTRKILAQRLGLTHSELSSLMRSVDSQLDLSISRNLRAHAE